MLLLVDIGNSAVKWIISETDRYQPLRKGILNHDQIEELRKFKDIPYKVVASVKPSLNPKLAEVLKNPIFVKNEDCLRFISSEYETTHTLGVDRLLNAIGGLNYADTFCVVSFGTATVVDLVVEKTFLGGAIFLGMEKHLKCLNIHAEQLPMEKPQIPQRPIGKNTKECLLSGVFYSQLFAVKGFVQTYKELYGVEKVILTGGSSDFFISQFESFVFDKELLFKGLFKVFYEVYF